MNTKTTQRIFKATCKLTTIAKILFFLLATLYAPKLSAQVYPDTIWIPVTYYDFHVDESNPEFECRNRGRVRYNAVADDLDSDKKPVVGSNPYINHYIKYWYRDWNDSAKGDFTIPKYTWSTDAVYNGPVNVSYDTAFKNIVIEDSLSFVHLGSGMYSYRDDTFFPIDGRGFGNEGKSHNFSFAMEMQTKFIMKEGLTFNFRGDDDVWAFTNNKLTMDLGGLHSAENGSFLTDTISTLVLGQEYDFSLFFAERHTTGSHIWITTNIVSTHIVTEVTIVANPPDATISAGDSVGYTGTVWYDSTGADGVTHHLPDAEMSEDITWSFVSNSAASNPANSSLSQNIGAQTIFTSTEAFETFTVTASYEDPYSHQISSATMNITIIAGPPNHLVVEETYDTSISLAIKQDDQPLDTLTIGVAVVSGNAYAMLRDEYGNFVEYSKNTTWNITSGSVIASAVTGTNTLGHGVITKHGPSGTGSVSATDLDHAGATYTDGCIVIVLNDAPVANNDVYTTAEDVILTIPGPGTPGILDNDIDSDPNAALTAHLIANVTIGALSLNSDGSFTYIPALNFNGNVVFTYRAYDGELYSNTATVTIIVGANNDPPVANNDNYTLVEDNTLSVAVSGILNNDNDIDGDALSAHLISGINASEGTLVLQSNGSFVYVPANNYNGSATFTYQAFDGTVNSNVATVTITVTPINDAPVATNDIYSVNEDNILTIPVAGVLGNDSDPDSDPLTATLATNVTSGTINLNANGSFTYTPIVNFNGTASFTYRANDGAASSNIATVTIIVVPINDLPIVKNDNFSVAEDNTLSVSAVNGVLGNDSDIEGDNLSVTLVNGIDASEGTLTLNADGSFVYIPTNNFNGTVIFTYQTHDGTGSSSNATVMIFVLATNDVPVANNDGYSTNEDITLTVPVGSGVCANDLDIDGDVLAVTLIDDITPTQGNLTLNFDGSFVYVPTTNYTGNFTFTYKVSDDSSTSNLATVTIWVGEQNDAPIAVNDNYSTAEDVTLTILTAQGVLNNDTDGDTPPDPLTALLVSSIDVSKGALSFNANGSFTFIPKLNFNGLVTFTYQANDGRLNSNIATVNITVAKGNDIPTANNDNYSTIEDVTLNIPAPGMPGLLSNDNDIDNDMLTAILVSTVKLSEGSLSFHASGSFIYTPAANYYGTASFTYKAHDGTVSSNTATVTITVSAVNDIPVIQNIPDQTIIKGNSFQDINLNNFVIDVDNTDNQLNWTINTPDNLLVIIDPVTHIATITLIDPLWHGSETITFTVTDPNGLSITDNVIFTVTPLPRLPMPETDSVPGIYTAHSKIMNLFVPGYNNANILYTYTTNGLMPKNPKITKADTVKGTGTVNFGSFVKDSTEISLLAFSSEYPHENSENRLFEYLLVFPQLPAPVATPVAGDYDTIGLAVALHVPNHSDASIYYTLDNTDPANSSTRIAYTGKIVLGPYTKITSATIRSYAEKTYYKPGTATHVYTFNPQALPKPVADPAGHRFHTDSISVKLYVPGVPDAEIRFTSDGSSPNKNSDLYSSLITINKNTTLKAIAIKDGNLPGPEMIEVYIQSLPTKIKLFPSVTSITVYPSTITALAGIKTPLVAKIFDQYDSVLVEYEIKNAPISWKIEEITSNNTGSLTNTTGYISNFIPEKAYNTVKIIATFSENGFVFDCEIIIIIKPGIPYRLWLEADYDRLVSPNKPNPIDKILLSSSKLSDEVYAIVRDSLGNWVSPSNSTIWLPAVNSIATVVSGKQNIGEGLINKGLNAGTINVIGENKGGNLSISIDSVQVQVLDYWYDSLKIVVKGKGYTDIDSLVMNTNIDSSIYVMGHRDDGLKPSWEVISAKWEHVDKSLEYIIANPPASAHEYNLSPVDTASGRIRICLDDDAVTIPDTVFVSFTPGSPIRVDIELLTPDSACIAGDTLRTVVRLYNADNKLVYGTWSYPGDGDSVMYNDFIGAGENRPDPVFVIDTTTYILSTMGTCAGQSFIEGLDTVDFVLYYAPFDQDSVHRLTVTLNYTLRASTRPFRLLANELKDIDIVVDNQVLDTVIIYYNNGKLFKTIGYDLWGNTIDIVYCNWSTQDGIPSILFPDNTKQIYYTVGNVNYVTSGFLTASHISNNGITDSVFIIIGPRPAKLVSAVTNDLNGNGYLDAITLYFDKKISFEENTLSDGLISGTLPLTPNSLSIAFDSLKKCTNPSGEKDSVYILSFDEYTTEKKPQTSWLPHISISQIEDLFSVTDKKCVDGAPPVVWSVIKQVNSVGQVEKDEVFVTLSEPIVHVDGSPFMYAAIKPSTILNIYLRDKNGFVHKENFLNGIDFFTKLENNTLIFNMSNKANLTSNHYVNLVFQDEYLADVPYNTPAINNQRVRVQVKGTIDNISIGPNPVIPTPVFWEETKDQPLTVINMNDGMNKVKIHGGCLVIVNLALSSDISSQDISHASGQLMIFDATGNLVYERENRNNLIPDYLMNSAKETSETIQIVFYWDGISDRGMPAAPGIYKTVVYIGFDDDARKLERVMAVGK